MKIKNDFNVGAAYDALVGKVSDDVVTEGKLQKSMLSVLRKHFGKGTVLNAELELQRSLSETYLGTKPLAERLLSSAKERARATAGQHLDVARMALMADLGDETFEVHVQDEIANQLLCEWRKGKRANPATVAKLEESVARWVAAEPQADAVPEPEPVHDPLVEKMMKDRVREKMNKDLGPRQRSLLEMYANGDEGLSDAITRVRRDVLAKTEGYVSKHRLDEGYVCDRLVDASKLITEHLDGKITGDIVARAMTALDLIDELGSKE